MKRSWIGLALLAALLLTSLGAGCLMARQQCPTVEDLTQAAAFAGAEDWDKALTHLRQARDRWEKGRKAAACIADHAALADIDEAFHDLEAQAATQDPQQFPATCQTLTQKLKSLTQSQTLTWWGVV